jgi:polyisoprenoid-binding protein YceI
MKIIALPLVLALAACTPEPAKDLTPATVEAPAAAPAPAAPADAGTSVALTGTIGFTGAKITGKHDGTFQTWSGKAILAEGALAGLEFEVDVASLKTDSEKLDGHLRSPDFFDVAAHPKANFVSTAITAGAPAESKLEGATHTVTGNLTLRGVTKTISFPAKVASSPDGSVAATTAFALQRKDFGIVYPGKPDDLIADDVAMRIDFIGKAGPATLAPAAPAAPAATAPAAAH